jgi:hypothetical protein
MSVMVELIFEPVVVGEGWGGGPQRSLVLPLHQRQQETMTRGLK